MVGRTKSSISKDFIFLSGSEGLRAVPRTDLDSEPLSLSSTEIEGGTTTDGVFVYATIGADIIRFNPLTGESVSIWFDNQLAYGLTTDGVHLYYRGVFGALKRIEGVVNYVAPEGETFDAFPLDSDEYLDTDSDGTGNNADTDDDNDGVSDTDEVTNGTNPLLVDTDGDGDTDNVDNCALLANADQLNTDGDAFGDVCDVDDDGDGVADSEDAFPLDAAETLDTDSDGTGNNADTDDDNDGVSDTDEATNGTNPLLVDTDGDGDTDNVDNCALLANADQLNTDGDAFGDVCDVDDDGDGVADSEDAFPLDAAETLDTDSDGTGNKRRY